MDMALHLLTHELKGRHDVVREYEENLPQVLGNEGQLSQVFLNLVVNALQAMKGKDEGAERGKVIVRVCRRDGGIAAEVVDNGMGIPEANQLKVFDPFFTTKPVGEGTGMGLAIAYSIVNNHGGKMSLKSKVGAGTTFTVWLPTSESSGAPAKATP
jgi:signal transduction histidine kinase